MIAQLKNEIEDLARTGFPNYQKINIKQQEGGLTNHNFLVEIDDEPYIFRLPGAGTNELVNRAEEKICTEAATALGIDAELLYFDAATGRKISRYLPQALTMNPVLMQEPIYLANAAETLRRLHDSATQVPVNFDVFEKIEEYEALISKVSTDYFWPDYSAIKAQVLALKAEVATLPIKRVLCHNDPLCENFVFSADQMFLVDWEYAGVNDPLWDVADVIIEAEYQGETEMAFLKAYFKQEPSLMELRCVQMNKVFLDFLWSLWGLQRFSCGIDLYDYATNRYLRAQANLKQL